jgi:hypothetical protein
MLNIGGLMNLTVIGLVLDIFGAWFLAYEIIWGYQKKDKAIYAEIRLKNIEKNYEISKRMISDDECKNWDSRMEKAINENQAIIDAAGRGHLEKSSKAAIFGIILLSVGFILQIVAALGVKNV